MRTRVVLSVLGGLFLVPASAWCQSGRLNINPATPWGAALQNISQESDPARKLGLIEKFVADYGSDAERREALLWIYPQKQALHVKRGEGAAVIEAAEKFLALDPKNATGDALPLMVQALKAAEAAKNAPAVRSWAVRTSGLARAAMAPRGAGEGEANARERIDYSRQVDIYTEYAIANAALQYAPETQAPELLDLLEQQNPRSAYLPQACQGAFAARRKQNQMDAAAGIAERCFEKQGATEDMLIVSADHYLRKNTSPDRVVKLSQGAVEMLKTRAKPEGVAEADWTQRRNLMLGLGYWMAGVTLSGQNQFAEADQSLRLALPLVENNTELLAPALFHLGLANFRLGEKAKDKARLTEAARFSKQCAAIKGPLQQQAAKNLQVIQQQHGIQVR